MPQNYTSIIFIKCDTNPAATSFTLVTKTSALVKSCVILPNRFLRHFPWSFPRTARLPPRCACCLVTLIWCNTKSTLASIFHSLCDTTRMVPPLRSDNWCCFTSIKFGPGHILQFATTYCKLFTGCLFQHWTSKSNSKLSSSITQYMLETITCQRTS